MQGRPRESDCDRPAVLVLSDFLAASHRGGQARAPVEREWSELWVEPLKEWRREEC